MWFREYDDLTSEAMFRLDIEPSWPSSSQMILPFYGKEVYETDITASPYVSFFDAERIYYMRKKIILDNPNWKPSWWD